MNDDRVTRKQVAAERQWAKQDRQDEDEALRAILQHRQGRKLIWKYLKLGRVGGQPFTANALTTAFNCGELNVGQQILAHLMEVDSAVYALMMQEQADDRSKRDAALRAFAVGAGSESDNFDDGDDA